MVRLKGDRSSLGAAAEVEHLRARRRGGGGGQRHHRQAGQAHGTKRAAHAHRDHAHRVLFITGQCAPAVPGPDWARCWPTPRSKRGSRLSSTWA